MAIGVAMEMYGMVSYELDRVKGGQEDKTQRIMLHLVQLQEQLQELQRMLMCQEEHIRLVTI